MKTRDLTVVCLGLPIIGSTTFVRYLTCSHADGTGSEGARRGIITRLALH